MKGLTDVDGGFFSRRGLGRTRYVFQETNLVGSFFYLGMSVLFAVVALSPTWARVMSGAVSVLFFGVFVSWLVGSCKAVMRAYRQDVEEKNERLVREVIDS